MSMTRSSAMNRRDWLKTMAGVGAGAALPGCAGSGSRSGTGIGQTGRGRSRLMELENQRPGTTEWSLKHPRIAAETRYRCSWIEGYCSRTSVRAAERLDVYVSTKPAAEFTIELYRMGFYGGAGGRLMGELGPFRGRVQPEPTLGRNRL